MVELGKLEGEQWRSSVLLTGAFLHLDLLSIVTL